MSMVGTWCYQDLADIWYNYHLKIINVKFLSGHLKKMNFVKLKLYGKPRWKGETLSTGGL